VKRAVELCQSEVQHSPAQTAQETSSNPPTSENIRLHALRGEGGENRLYGEDGTESINAQLRAGLGGAPERIFGGEGTTPSPRPTG
jgi:hypothetical protein